ncbi:restriction endonuclease [Vibrio alginolyticus]
MTRFSTSQIPPPSNWQDFESLCKDLFKRVWSDPHTQKNGRVGQAQHGVDISGRPDDAGGGYFGVQCKGKDNYLDKTVTISELKNEVEKAQKFSPKLKSFIIVTTGVKDGKVEELARLITEEHYKEELFSVSVYGWLDILEVLEEHEDIIEKHYPWLYLDKLNRFCENKYIYDFWSESIKLNKLSYNANYLPFHSNNVCFSNDFLVDVKSYLLRVEKLLASERLSLINTNLRGAIENFNKVASDWLAVCELYENKYDYNNQLVIYWVDLEDIELTEMSRFVRFRKGVLKAMFYNLIKSSNYIINIYNENVNNNDSYKKFIPFRYFAYIQEASFDPMYCSQELEDIGLYQGVKSIEDYIGSQIYDDWSLRN